MSKELEKERSESLLIRSFIKKRAAISPLSHYEVWT